MSQLDSPGSIEELYRDRDSVPYAVPIMQGDVFREIPVPGLQDDPMTVQVVMHPCSLRRGAVLRERITVAPVADHKEGVSSGTWQRSFLNHMLLPRLYGDDRGGLVELRDLAPVSSIELALSKRIASLSADGLLLLQQRLVFSQTRLVVEKAVLADAMAPIAAEAEMQETWVDLAINGAGLDEADDQALDVIERALGEFHAWLDDSERARRILLQQRHQHAALRRDASREAKERYGG